jgi:hypothetical protein
MSAWQRGRGGMRDWPSWAKVAAGLVVALVVLGVVITVADDDEPGRSAPAADATTSTLPGSTSPGSSSPGSTDQAPSTDAPAAVAPTSTEPLPPGTWTEVGSLTGTGDQHGDPFPLGGKVRVGYRSAEGSFEVFLVDSGGPGSPVATCPDACDEQVVVDIVRGDYFIEVRNPGEWTVIVEELR